MAEKAAHLRLIDAATSCEAADVRATPLVAEAVVPPGDCGHMVPRGCLLDTAPENPSPTEGAPPEISAPKKSKPGRPKGSRNKVTREAKALLAAKGHAAIDTLIRIASGRPVFRQLKGGGRERLNPDLPQILEAARIVVDRLVPALKSVEAKSSVEVTDKTPSLDPESRQVARAILDIARSDEGHTVAAGAAGLGPIAAVPPVPPAPSGSDASDSDVEAAREQIGNGFIECVRKEPGRDGRELWHIFDSMGEARGAEWGRDAARKKATELHARGKLK